MPRPLRWSTYASFARGMVQDVPRHLLPDDAVWDAENVFVKRSGALAKRGGTTAALSSGSTVVPGWIATMYSSAADGVAAVYAFTATTWGGARIVAQGTAAAPTDFTSSTATIGRPFRHENLVLVPQFAASANSSNRPVSLFGGCSLASISVPSSPTTIVATAGSETITGLSVADAALLVPGCFMTLVPAGNNPYTVFRVVSVGSTTAVVEPTPTQTFTNNASGGIFAAYQLLGLNATTFGYPVVTDSRCGASFQNRVVIGGTREYTSAGNYGDHPNRLRWGNLLVEGVTAPSGQALLGYAGTTSNYGFPQYNYVDLPSSQRLVAFEPIGQGQLLILSDRSIYMLVGDLETITVASGNIAFSIQQISTSVGCISDKTVQMTPLGVVFAAREGVMLFDGSRLQNVTNDKIGRLWRDTYATATMQGSAVLSNHYYISTSAGGLLFNMTTGAWTKVSGVDITGGPGQDLSNSNRVYAAKYGASSSSATDKIVRLDTILDPSSAVTSDATGTAVAATIKTKTYTEGDPHNLTRFRHTAPVVTVKGSNNVTVTATPGLEGEETSSTLGTITPSATGPQRKRYDHQIIAPAIGYTISTAAATDEMELTEVRIGSNQLRPGRTT